MPASQTPAPSSATRPTPRAHPALRGLAVAVLLLYPLGAGALLLTPDGWAVNRLNVRIWYAVTSPLGLHGTITPELFAHVMNVLLFIPLFAALAILVPTRWWIGVGAGISIAVETYQALIGTRDATVVDVLTNTAGTVIGVGLGMALRRSVGRRRRSGLSRASASRPPG